MNVADLLESRQGQDYAFPIRVGLIPRSPAGVLGLTIATRRPVSAKSRATSSATNLLHS